MNHPIQQLLLAGVLVVIGLAGGWFAAVQGDKAEPEGVAAVAGGLSSQALKNLNVTVKKVQLGEFTRHIHVQAMVVDRPQNSHPVTAHFGGIVTKLHVATGDVVAAGGPVATLVRDPIPRPELTLTADILTPVSERMHDGALGLRTAIAHRDIAKSELERVRPFVKEGAVARQKLIDLEYALLRAERAVANARRELEWHGLTGAEIDSVGRGEPPPKGRSLWKRALQRNHLWGERQDALLAALPEGDRDLPWSVAAIGELSAAGLVTAELVEAVVAVPQLADHFVDTASLLLMGHSIAKVRTLGEAGALDAEVILRAPKGGAPDFDVAELAVRPGRRLQSGEPVALLHDARRMWLRVEPLGGEVRAVSGALGGKMQVRATPLLKGTGPVLEKLSLLRLDTRAGRDERGSVAYAACDNEPLRAVGKARSWALRVGLRYIVEVPAETIENCFVLPASAVTTQGPEIVVFLPDGKTFHAEPVHLLFRDEEFAVVAADGSIAAGDMVVMTGAFGLGLALQDIGGAVDPHAGHNH